jgi:hypothetical protein
MITVSSARCSSEPSVERRILVLQDKLQKMHYLTSEKDDLLYGGYLEII